MHTVYILTLPVIMRACDLMRSLCPVLTLPLTMQANHMFFYIAYYKAYVLVRHVLT